MGFYDAFTVSAWIRPAAASGAFVTRVKDEAEGQGWSLNLRDGHVQLNMVERWLDEQIVENGFDCARFGLDRDSRLGASQR